MAWAAMRHARVRRKILADCVVRALARMRDPMPHTVALRIEVVVMVIMLLVGAACCSCCWLRLLVASCVGCLLFRFAVVFCETDSKISRASVTGI